MARKRRFHRPPSHDGTVRNRKALQLAKQVERALMLAMAGHPDWVLNDLMVVRVRPAPDTTRLLVSVASSTGAGWQAADVLARLVGATGELRGEVATAINRKKVPELAFEVV